MKPALLVLAFAVLCAPAAAAEAGTAHADPVARVVLFLATILIGAKLGGALAERLGQPAVLGELVAGVALGNLDLFGVHALEALPNDPAIDMLARIGVLLLLFEVGLESTVAQMAKVGASSLLVATLGVAAPFALGWGVGALLLPEESGYAHAFLGATLCATSVGITARVLQDLGRSTTPEARVILGAAVIDDVFGLVILAVVAGAIQAAGAGGSFSAGEVALVVLKAGGFLGAALVVGSWFSPRLFGVASRLQTRGVLLAVALAFCFALSWAASAIGLAPIVGAFAAGLVLEDAHVQRFRVKGERQLEELVRPLTSVLVPVFFVQMGMRTELDAFAEPGVLGLALALCVAGIVGKQVCGLGVVDRGIDRVTVGIGMVPRGEVGLIFANVGLGLTLNGERIVDERVFSAIVVMVIATTLLAPPGLKWSLGRLARRPLEPRGPPPEELDG